MVSFRSITSAGTRFLDTGLFARGTNYLLRKVGVPASAARNIGRAVELASYFVGPGLVVKAASRGVQAARLLSTAARAFTARTAARTLATRTAARTLSSVAGARAGARAAATVAQRRGSSLAARLLARVRGGTAGLRAGKAAGTARATRVARVQPLSVAVRSGKRVATATGALAGVRAARAVPRTLTPILTAAASHAGQSLLSAAARHPLATGAALSLGAGSALVNIFGKRIPSVTTAGSTPPTTLTTTQDTAVSPQQGDPYAGLTPDHVAGQYTPIPGIPHPDISARDFAERLGLLPTPPKPSITDTAISPTITPVETPKQQAALPSEDELYDRIRKAFANEPQQQPLLPTDFIPEEYAQVIQQAQPQDQFSLLQEYARLRQELGLDKYHQLQLKLLSVQEIATQEIEKMLDEIRNDPDIPLTQRRRRIERVLAIQKDIASRIASQMKLLKEQMALLENELETRMGLIASEEDRKRRERDFSLKLFRFLVETGAVGAFTDSELQRWATLLQAPVGALRRVKNLTAHPKRSYVRQTFTDANGTTWVYFFDKNDPTAQPIRVRLGKSSASVQEYLQARERADSVAELLLRSGYSPDEAEQIRQEVFLRYMPNARLGGSSLLRQLTPSSRSADAASALAKRALDAVLSQP